jgi:hypothetical protein
MKTIKFFSLCSLIVVASNVQAMDADTPSLWQKRGKPAAEIVGGISCLAIAYSSARMAHALSKLGQNITKNAGKSDFMAHSTLDHPCAGLPALGSLGFKGTALFGGMTGAYLLYKAYNTISATKKG